jgi:hypothetical protein
MPLSSPPTVRTSDEAARLQGAIAQTAGVPFYEAGAWQAAFADRPAQLADLPRITKSQLREHSPEGFLPVGLTVESLLARGLIEEESTSGTSGASVRVVGGAGTFAEFAFAVAARVASTIRASSPVSGAARSGAASPGSSLPSRRSRASTRGPPW